MTLPHDYGFCSHLPCLCHYAVQTSGSIIELGAGYSTGVLHSICQGKRLLVTVENNPEWLRKYEHLRSADHLIVPEMTPEMHDWHWDVAFIDSAPVESRVKYIDHLCHRAKYLVVHDYQLDGHNYPVDFFANKRVWGELEPKTIVLSHFVSL
jgi:hypothetical protein